MVHRIKNGSIRNSPEEVKDFNNAVIMWLEDLGTLKGKMTRVKPKHVYIQETVISVDRDVIVSIDIFFIGGIMFLLSISRRVQLMIVSYLEKRDTSMVQKALNT
jgi:hypothetical protein